MHGRSDGVRDGAGIIIHGPDARLLIAGGSHLFELSWKRSFVPLGHILFERDRNCRLREFFF